MPTRTIEVSQLVADIEAEQERRGWSNRKVARELAISPSTLTNWYGGMQPTLTGENIAGLCRFLSIDSDEVLRRLGWWRTVAEAGEMGGYLTLVAA